MESTGFAHKNFNFLDTNQKSCYLTRTNAMILTDEKFWAEFGEYLKEKRLKADYSQREVSEKLGYSSPQFISNIERGLCAPPMPSLKILISLYKIPVKEVTKIILDHQQKLLTSQLSSSRRSKKSKRSA